MGSGAPVPSRVDHTSRLASLALVIRIQHITVDSHSPYELARFWSTVTGWPISAEDTPDSDEVLLEPPDKALPELLFVTVAEDRPKNSWHLDLMPLSGSRDEEVERLLAAGATLVADHRVPDGRGWVVLADPEGNQFCIERGESERG